jgi:ABC-type transport system involved in multi-copper enzyme maturation permease subunit
MPIHDQGYRRYAGRRAAHGNAWWVIARQHMLTALKYRPFVILLLLSWAPFVVRAVQIYVSTYQQAAILQPTPRTYRDFLDFQSICVFLVTISMAGLIADDKRANALQVYLSKPLGRIEYITGKLVALLVYLLGVTLVPAIMLLLVQILFTGSVAFLRQNLFLLPAITLFALTQSLLSAFTMLALSSLSKSRRFVSIMFAGLIFFTAAMYQALRTITGSRAWAVISPGEMLDVLGNAIFRIEGASAVPTLVAALVVLLLIGASVWILERRVRGIEVVA